MGNKPSPMYLPIGTTGIDGNPENSCSPEDTGATNGVDSVDHTTPIDGMLNYDCTFLVTPTSHCTLFGDSPNVRNVGYFTILLRH